MRDMDRDAAARRSGDPLRPFVEELAVTFEADGLPRMAGRIFAFLLVCRPAEQTAASLARELEASGGSISTMVRLLVGAGLVERVSQAGVRADHFRVTPEGIRALMDSATARVARVHRVTTRGLGLLTDRPPEDRARLAALDDLYAYFEDRMPSMVEDWERRHFKESR
jgi:DNA-binding transcriptional regulator GbsR (MarR family)